MFDLAKYPTPWRCEDAGSCGELMDRDGQLISPIEYYPGVFIAALINSIKGKAIIRLNEEPIPADVAGWIESLGGFTVDLSSTVESANPYDGSEATLVANPAEPEPSRSAAALTLSDGSTVPVASRGGIAHEPADKKP